MISSRRRLVNIKRALSILEQRLSLYASRIFYITLDSQLTRAVQQSVVLYERPGSQQVADPKFIC